VQVRKNSQFSPNTGGQLKLHYNHLAFSFTLLILINTFFMKLSTLSITGEKSTSCHA
jgi:hypothetical protein